MKATEISTFPPGKLRYTYKKEIKKFQTFPMRNTRENSKSQANMVLFWATIGDEKHNKEAPAKLLGGGGGRGGREGGGLVVISRGQS